MDSPSHTYARRLGEAAIIAAASKPFPAYQLVLPPRHGSKAEFVDIDDLLTQEPPCIVLQRDTCGGGKVFGPDTLPHFLERVSKSRAHRLENGDASLYHNTEATMYVKLAIDWDSKKANVTPEEFRAAVQSSLNRVCAAIAAQGLPCDQAHFAVHVGEGNVASAHGMQLRGFFAATIGAMKALLQTHVIPTLTELEKQLFDVAIYKVGAFRDIDMTKIGQDRFLAAAPDAALSGAAALALFHSAPRLYRLLWVPTVIHPDDLADPNNMYGRAAAPLPSAPPPLPVAAAPGAGGGAGGGGGGGAGAPFRKEAVLAAVDAMVLRLHPAAARRHAQWRSQGHRRVVSVEYSLAPHAPSRATKGCLMAGKHHATHYLLAEYCPVTGRVTGGCFSESCRARGKAKAARLLGFAGARGAPRVVRRLGAMFEAPAGYSGRDRVDRAHMSSSDEDEDGEDDEDDEDDSEDDSEQEDEADVKFVVRDRKDPFSRRDEEYRPARQHKRRK